MPCKLIRKLRELMEMDFQAPTTNAVVLGDHDTPELPDEVMDRLDLIGLVAREIFGTRLEPSSKQQEALKACGFPIKPGVVDHLGWKSGHIVTPKGIIVYD